MWNNKTRETCGNARCKNLLLLDMENVIELAKKRLLVLDRQKHEKETIAIFKKVVEYAESKRNKIRYKELVFTGLSDNEARAMVYGLRRNK